MTFLNTWQFNLIGYYIFVVIFYQFYKLAVRGAKHDGAATILLQTLAGLSILVLLPLFPIAFPSSWTVYALLVVASVFYALADRLNTTARKNLEVSTFSIVSQLSTVFLLVFGWIFFRESFMLTKVFGAGLILGGNILLMYKRGLLKPNGYVLLASAAAAMFAAAISIDIGISAQFNLPFYIMFTLIVPALMNGIVERISPAEIVAEFYTTDRKYYLITGVAWALAILFALRSFQFGQVTTIVPLQAVQVLLNVAVAYFFLKEHSNTWKKIIAALLVIGGVYLTVQ